MKKAITTIASALFILFPIVCTAAWVIHLKDGRSFTTPEYREEGDQIKFERYGGLIGIPRDQVIDIEEIADEPEKEVQKAPEAPPVPESKEDTATVQEAPPPVPPRDEKENEADKKKEDPQVAFMKEKRRILDERENVSQAFKAAKAKNDRKQKDLYWNKLLQLQNELQQLQNRATTENKNVQPPWWDQIQ